MDDDVISADNSIDSNHSRRSLSKPWSTAACLLSFALLFSLDDATGLANQKDLRRLMIDFSIIGRCHIASCQSHNGVNEPDLSLSKFEIRSLLISQ